MSMKIVIDARIINSSTGRYVERLLTYLEEIDTSNEYVALIPTKDLDYWTPTKQNFSVVACDIPSFSFAEQTTLLRQIRSLNADLVHFCMPQQPIFYRRRKVTTIHDLTQLRTHNPDKNWFIYRCKRLVGWFVFKYIIWTNNHIVTDSHYSEDDIIRFSKRAAHKISTIYLSADKLAATSPKSFPLASEQFILYVGQQAEHKNVRRLILAHQLLLKERPELLLVLTGRTSSAVRRMQKFVTEHGYKNVVFTDFIPDTQLAWLYENCLAYVFPSLAEGFGMPGLEAMRHGAPVVSSDATCSPEIYGNAARYFNPLAVDNMAATIASVIDSEPTRRELKRLGYSRVKQYSWQRMAEQTLAVYNEAITK